MELQVFDDCLFVERLDAQTEVIDVAPFGARRRAAFASQRAVDGNQVDQRRAGANMDEAEIVPAPDDFASEHPAIEIDRLLEVENPKDQMIDALHRKERHAASK